MLVRFPGAPGVATSKSAVASVTPHAHAVASQAPPTLGLCQIQDESLHKAYRRPVRSPRALAVIADLPSPPRSGNHLRDLQNLTLLDLLGYDVSVVAGDHSPGGGREVGDRARLVGSVPIAPESTDLAARGRRLLRLASGALRSSRPGPWALPYVDAGLPAVVASAIDELSPDVLVLRSTLADLAACFRPLVRTVVLDVHDAETFLARSLLSLSDPLHSAVGVVRLAAAARAERLSAIADEVWAPSAREAAHLRRVAQGTPVLVVPNGVPVPGDPPARRRRRRDLLLVAGFGYPPNEAAAIRLVEEILPQVERSFPETRVCLVGRDLRSELSRRWSGRPVVWHGVVDDLEPFYANSAALVLAYDPSTDAGTPLKVAEALACGLPVVATRNATQPLGLVHDVHVLNADHSEAIAESVCRILDDPESAHQMALRGYARAREALDPTAIAASLRTASLLGQLATTAAP